jgi:hypothetical protein
MRRAHLFVTAVAIAAAPVFARPVGAPKPFAPNHVVLDLSGVHLFHQPSAPSAGFAGWHENFEPANTPSLSKLGAGPLHAEFGLDDNPRANLSPYKMQGADQLGSSIWQAEQGKSAKLMFTWPTEK